MWHGNIHMCIIHTFSSSSAEYTFKPKASLLPQGAHFSPPVVSLEPDLGHAMANMILYVLCVQHANDAFKLQIAGDRVTKTPTKSRLAVYMNSFEPPTTAVLVCATYL